MRSFKHEAGALVLTLKSGEQPAEGKKQGAGPSRIITWLLKLLARSMALPNFAGKMSMMGRMAKSRAKGGAAGHGVEVRPKAPPFPVQQSCSLGRS